MQGHYPPICYPSSGCAIDGGAAHTWQTAGLSINGTEYVVTNPKGERTTIRNFFVLPNGKIARDMISVNAAVGAWFGALTVTDFVMVPVAPSSSVTVSFTE